TLPSSSGDSIPSGGRDGGPHHTRQCRTGRDRSAGPMSSALRLRGQTDVKAGPSGQIRPVAEGAAVGAYDRVADRKPEPGSLGFRREEGVEEALECLG